MTARAFSATVFHQSRHLEDKDTYDCSENCPICGVGKKRNVVGQIQFNPPIFLLDCSNCHGASASRMPQPRILEEFYSQYYRPEEQVHVTFHNPDRFAGHIAGLIHRNGFSGKNLLKMLDFGGGDGTVALALAGWLPVPCQITVVDYEDGTAGDGKIIWARSLDEVTGPFDLILASAVLEHIPEVQPVFEQLFSRLAPRGIFYARSPWIAPYMKHFRQFDFAYPGHVHDMGAAFWNRVPRTFSLEADLVASRTSIVETEFSRNFWRTLTAYLAKTPALVEQFVRPRGRDPWWKYVGSWEAVLMKRG